MLTLSEKGNVHFALHEKHFPLPRRFVFLPFLSRRFCGRRPRFYCWRGPACRTGPLWRDRFSTDLSTALIGWVLGGGGASCTCWRLLLPAPAAGRLVQETGAAGASYLGRFTRNCWSALGDKNDVELASHAATELRSGKQADRRCINLNSKSHAVLFFLNGVEIFQSVVL